MFDPVMRLCQKNCHGEWVIEKGAVCVKNGLVSNTLEAYKNVKLIKFTELLALAIKRATGISIKELREKLCH